MKTSLVLVILVLSSQVFAQKAVDAVVPQSAQTHKMMKTKTTTTKVTETKGAVAPCDTKEDILKKLEDEKKAQAAAGKGLSLQGKTDSGCTIK